MELQTNLVTLIAPFYNGEKYLDRFLRSILAQTYTNVQFILVNDGSTDGSDVVVEKYRDELNSKFAEFLYLHQENGGAACAVNTALKYVKGEYLCWADCDDELLPKNIERKYEYLKEHDECGLVNCGAEAINQDTGEKIRDLVIPHEKRKDNMFERIINGIPVYIGVFMIRTQLLFDKLSNREIYFNREAGQNYQLSLPVAYDHKCGFIDDMLYRYYVRSDSHSHNVDYEKTYQRTYVRETLLDNVLTFMNPDEKKKLMCKIHSESSLKRFDLSFQNDDKVRNNESFRELLEVKADISKKRRIKHLIINVGWLNKIYRLRG